MRNHYKKLILAVYLLTAFSYVLLNIEKPKEALGAAPWLPDYDYRKSVTVGSGSVAPGTNYVPSIKISNLSNPIASSTYTINGKTYNHRIKFDIEEIHKQNLTDQWVRLFVDTHFLYINGYYGTNSLGADVEFAAEGETAGKTYAYDPTRFNQYPNWQSTEYYVKMSLTALQATTTYMYFDSDITATSTNFNDKRTYGETTYTTEWEAGNDMTIYWSNNGSSLYAARSSYGWLMASGTALTIEYTDSNGSQATTTKYAASGNDVMDYWTLSYLGNKCATSSLFRGGNAGYGFVFYDGLRLTNIPVQRGATINRAYLTLVPYQNDSGKTVNTFLAAENVMDSAPFTTCAQYISRSTTTAKVNWNSIGTWTANATTTSPDIKWVIKELVGTSTFTAYVTASSTLYQPLVRSPFLFEADVYLDGASQNWPYDIDFTTSDGTTQLYYDTEKETELSATQNFVTFKPKITDSIGANTTYQIFIYYGKNNNNVRSPYYRPDLVYTTHQPFDATTGINKVNGTWGISAQQTPVFRGDQFRNSRNPVLVNKDGIWYMFYIKTNYYDSIAGLPWSTRLATSTDLQHWNIYGDIMQSYTTNDLNTAGGSGLVNMYFGSIATDTAGVYWAAYTQNSGNVSFASSSDLVHWSMASTNPHYNPYTAGSCAKNPYDFSLGFDGVDQWYLYFTGCYHGGPTSKYADNAFATSTGSTPMGTWLYQNSFKYNTIGSKVYQENYDLKKYGNTYYWIYSDNYYIPQRIGIATSSNFSGPWSDLGLISKTRDVMEQSLQGTGKVSYYNGVYYMMYSAEPFWYGGYANGSPISLMEVDNFYGLATSSQMNATTTWNATFMDNMYAQTNNTLNLLSRATTTGTYGNMSMVVDMMHKWQANNQEIGVTWRDDNAGNYFMADYAIASSSLNVWKVTNNVRELIASTYLNFDYDSGGVIHRIRVDVYEGQNIVSYSGNGEDWVEVWNNDDDTFSNTGSVGIYTMGANGYFSNLDIRPFVYPDVQFGGIVTETPPTSYRMPLLGGTRIKMTGGGRFIIGY